MARTESAARRYAEAVFELARRDDTEDAWRVALAAAAEALGKPEVLRIVENPAIPLAERLAAVRAALAAEALAEIVSDVIARRRSLGATGDLVREAIRAPVGKQLVNLVGLLVERRRVERLPDIAREYDRLLDRSRGVVTAVVTSAARLSDEDAAAVRARVEAMTGSDVAITTVVDPALIGGLTVQIGDRLHDASVRGRLERLRNQLLAGSRQAHGSGA
jgi:F-type H+-transporting ATPase subunit delta